MSSFYGGKQGRTYHIVQRYDTVQQMVEAFSGGGAYTDANYGQYVLIDTVLTQGRSSSLENGLLYRRGFDYNDSYANYEKPNPEDEDFQDQNGFNQELFQQAWAKWVQHPGNGAIYVGQIVGPQGRSPEIEIESWEEFQQETAGTHHQVIISRRPGKQVDGQNISYNDDIKSGYVNIRNQHGDIVGCKIAFDIPYTILESQVVDDNPYSNSNVVEDNISINHPFYYKWNFTTPKGKHGQDIDQIKIEQGKDISQSYTRDGFNNQIQDNDKYFVYTTKNYDQGQSGDTDEEAAILTQHQGRWPYRVINQIIPSFKTRQIKRWRAGYQAKIGDLQYVRRSDSVIIKDIYYICISQGQIDTRESLSPAPEGYDEDYLLGWTTTSGNSQWRVIKIPNIGPVNELTVDYTAGENDTFPLHNLDYLSVDTEGNLYAFYSDSTQPHYLTNIGGLKSVEMDDTDGIVFTYLDGSKVSYPLKQIEKITYSNNDITQSQDIIVHYKDGQFQDVTQQPINLVAAVDRLGDNLIVLYSDPNVRNSIPQDKQIIKNWTDPVSSKTYEDLIWYNFGPLGAQYHVQGEYTLADLKGDILDPNFKIDLSYGFSGDLEDRMGWLVTVSDDNNNKYVYAFDYNDNLNNPSHKLYDNTPSCWYEILSISQQMINPNKTIAISPKNQEPVDLLDNGIWCVVSYGHDNI